MTRNNERLIELLTCSVVLAIGRGKDSPSQRILSPQHTLENKCSELAQDSTEHIELARMTF